VVDLLSQKAYIWDDSGQPENFEVRISRRTWSTKARGVPREAHRDRRRAGRRPDGGLPRGNEPSLEDIKRCIRKGTHRLDFFPTYCGSAFKNKGVQLVLDAVVDYLPSPTEVEPQPEVDLEGNETGEKAVVDPEEPFARWRSRSWMTATAP
jgi:elongation factor G